MSDKKLNGVPALSVGQIVEKLANGYAQIVKSKQPFKKFPAVMLWGAPGVGKSQAVRQMADELSLLTGKKTVVTDVRLLLFNPVDLRGIPSANADKTLSVWLKPKIFQMDESESVINILFLDEITAAPQSVQAAAYQITLDRVIGEHKLPENCIVLAAGNRTSDRSVSYKMPKALANRLMHFEVENSFEGWRKWAVGHAVNEKVVGFLSFRRDLLLAQADEDDLAYPTPRSWEMASNILNFVEPDARKAYALLAGVIGKGAAVEFCNWVKIYSTLPAIEDIFDGKSVPVPKGTDVLYALASSMTAYAREHKNDMRRITNAIAFAQQMPPDFSAMLLKDFMNLDKDYKKKLMGVPEFMRWLNEKGKLLNGNI